MQTEYVGVDAEAQTDEDFSMVPQQMMQQSESQSMYVIPQGMSTQQLGSGSMMAPYNQAMAQSNMNTRQSIKLSGGKNQRIQSAANNVTSGAFMQRPNMGSSSAFIGSNADHLELNNIGSFQFQN
mmetsp:Transcript_5792/g.9240  ORF Transcript_5792/g.9240 Transcript_5792/m.9240 type:complete len:125 (+) Transcript_5792:3110-3484(+)